MSTGGPGEGRRPVGTGRRGALLAFLAVIVVNLAVLPTWFSPGRFPLGLRMVLATLSIVLIAYSAWRVGNILGVNPFSRTRPRGYAPYALDDEDDDEDDILDEGHESPRDRRRRLAAERERREEERRAFGQADTFREYDPYDEGPDPVHDPTERARDREE